MDTESVIIRISGLAILLTGILVCILGIVLTVANHAVPITLVIAGFLCAGIGTVFMNLTKRNKPDLLPKWKLRDLVSRILSLQRKYDDGDK